MSNIPTLGVWSEGKKLKNLTWNLFYKYAWKLKYKLFNYDCVREDTQKKSVFFSGRASKGVGRVNPTDH